MMLSLVLKAVVFVLSFVLCEAMERLLPNACEVCLELARLPGAALLSHGVTTMAQKEGDQRFCEALRQNPAPRAQ